MGIPPLLKFLSIVIGECIVESMKENFFLFTIFVASFKQLFSSIVGGAEEGFAYGNEALGKQLA